MKECFFRHHKEKRKKAVWPREFRSPDLIFETRLGYGSFNVIALYHHFLMSLLCNIGETLE